jgi:hypothetical protein
MFHGTYDRADRADRYRKVAAEYTGLSEATSDQFLRSYYLRIAEDYQDQSLLEMRELEREQITALATGADMPSPTPQPNHAS